MFNILKKEKIRCENNQKPLKPYRKIVIYVLILISAYLVFNICFFNAEIPSSSMEGTINKNDRVLGFRFAYTFSDIDREDVIIFKDPDTNVYMVKRVIGLPGDKIEFINDFVYVNGMKNNEEYLSGKTVSGDLPNSFYVPKDSYFLLGDNRENSKDSRYWVHHFITKDNVYAEVFLKYYKGIKLL